MWVGSSLGLIFSKFFFERMNQSLGGKKSTLFQRAFGLFCDLDEACLKLFYAHSGTEKRSQQSHLEACELLLRRWPPLKSTKWTPQELYHPESSAHFWKMIWNVHRKQWRCNMLANFTGHRASNWCSSHKNGIQWILLYKKSPDQCPRTTWVQMDPDPRARFGWDEGFILRACSRFSSTADLFTQKPIQMSPFHAVGLGNLKFQTSWSPQNDPNLFLKNA